MVDAERQNFFGSVSKRVMRLKKKKMKIILESKREKERKEREKNANKDLIIKNSNLPR